MTNMPDNLELNGEEAYALARAHEKKYMKSRMLYDMPYKTVLNSEVWKDLKKSYDEVVKLRDKFRGDSRLEDIVQLMEATLPQEGSISHSIHEGL